MRRPEIDETLMKAAWLWSERGTCSRLQVGAVLTRDTRVISSGYNGAPKKLEHCVHEDNSPCEISAHAEENALIFAAREGISTDGTVMYTTYDPCSRCARLIINAGVKEVVYDRIYRRSTGGLDLLARAGIPTRQIEWHDHL
jgi:dCMP deaminase